ncbi:MAG: hypothetical protein U0840_31465 [Gemmataceae bacterium]
MLNLIGWVVVGLFIGAAARTLIPGVKPLSTLMTLVLGMLGALFGGMISWAIWGIPLEPLHTFPWVGYFFAILGALLLLGMYVRVAIEQPRQ